MPIYEYECQRCGDRVEIIQKVSEGPKRKCPSCGERGLKRLISAAAFHLKGTGWYVTDFRDKAKTQDKDKDKGKEKDKSTEKAADSDSNSSKGDKSETKSDAKKSETKNASSSAAAA